ncbi:MAG: ABC transporter permease [Chloroflexi bacterium]|nr:ABC transporter permease [Chloroflexota bacterium]
MDVIWRKVWRDLWTSPLRTLLVVASTAIGIFALGLVFGLSDILHTRMTEHFRASRPPHVTIAVSTIFDQEIVATVRRIPGVAAVEGDNGIAIRWKLDGEAGWRDGRAQFYARADYDNQQINLIELVTGSWPTSSTSSHPVAVDIQSAQHFQVPLGATVIVEMGRSERQLLVEAIVRDPAPAPPIMGGPAVFYVDLETLAWMVGENEGFRRLHVRLRSFTGSEAEQMGERIKDHLEGIGLTVGGFSVTDPNVHPAQETISSLLLVLSVMGALSLALSGFLIVNTMNALVAQQIWQIGVLKVLGASIARVIGIYLAPAAIYGVLSMVVALPLGAVSAYGAALSFLDLVNTPAGRFSVSPSAMIIQVAVGLFVPVVAALAPVMSGAQITVHRAISTYGLGAGFGHSWLDRLMGGIRRIPPLLAMSLRNTIRRKTRIALTLLTLTLGGITFIVVMSVGDSLNTTLEVLLDELSFDVLVILDQPQRVERIVEATRSIPDVTAVEVWDYRGARLSIGDNQERDIVLWGVPPNSEMFHPRIVSGRGLTPGDGRAILLNSKIAADEGFQTGDVITLTIDGARSEWTVVGLILNVNNQQRDNWVPVDTLTSESGIHKRGVMVTVAAGAHDPDAQATLIRNLRAAYSKRDIELADLQSANQVREANQTAFDIIVYLMLFMAVLAAVVGSVGLMSTMSINVVERAREIGVMRAIGATSTAILSAVVAEGTLVGVLSWLIALPFSYPSAFMFGRAVGLALLKVPLDFSYSLSGAMIWLVIVIILSAIASLWPAMKATRVSVREALAYE